jgi:poly [ADP-ribose] polymerase
MSHVIESAKSSRASCRGCKKTIQKGELRFGLAVPSAFSDEPQLQWYHLLCGAGAKPAELKDTLAAFSGEVPNRAEVDRAIEEGGKKQKPGKFPYAEHAPSARSRCIVCETPIAKGQLRVAIERQVDTGAFNTVAPGYMHPKCAKDSPHGAGLMDALKANSKNLSDADWGELGQALG